MPAIIYVVKDTHSHSDGRALAQSVLEATPRRVSFFFIEWGKPISTKNSRAIEKSFPNLSPSDALPDLIELTRIAVEHNIEVIPCDLAGDATLAALNKTLSDSEKQTHPYKESSLYQPWGEAVRDKHAAEVIRQMMLDCAIVNSAALLMFGTDHFIASKYRDAPPLDILIKEGGGIDLHFLN